MNLSDIQTFLMGLGWVLLFFGPMIFAGIGVSEEENGGRGAAEAFFVAFILQVIFMLCIAHSWRH